MKNIYNEYGSFMDNELYEEIRKLALPFSELIERLLNEGVPVIEIRALTEHINGTIGGCIAANILRHNIAQNKKRIASKG